MNAVLASCNSTCTPDVGVIPGISTTCCQTVNCNVDTSSPAILGSVSSCWVLFYLFIYNIL